MASIRRRIDGGIYYARLRYKDNDTGKAKEKSISLMTTSEEIAMSRLHYVNRMENEIKSGSTDLSSIRFNKIYSYDDINNTGSEITTHDGYIYFILTKEVISDMYKRVKIGYTSKKPSVRLHELEKGSSIKLEMIGYMKGNVQLEQAIHKMFKDYNVHNEWYTYNYTMKELINCFRLKKERKKKVCNV